MLGMQDKNKREQVEFFIKNTILVTGAIIALCYGTQHLEKFDLEQTLKSKLIGDTNIFFSRFGVYEADKADGKYCEVSGSYQIKNIGEYPFVVDWVKIQLVEVPYIEGHELLKDKPTSYTLFERMQTGARFPVNPIGDEIKLEVNEQFGKQNILQRSFGFIVPVDHLEKAGPESKSRYVIVATAQAGLDQDGNGKVDKYEKGITPDEDFKSKIEFLQNDLTHISATFNMCQSAQLQLSSGTSADGLIS